MQTKASLITLLIFSVSSLLLTGCDTYPYKEKIQNVYDNHNPTGDKALCMMVGSVTKSMYPYTTYYIEGQDLPFAQERRKAFNNRAKNDGLHLFAGIGFFTEEYAGEVDGRATYRYDLTDLGRKYVDWTFGETNFCFGRVVVDKINRTKDTINGVGGGTVRDVYFTYHLENVPDWVKDPQIYKRFRYFKEQVNGEPFPGIHSYKVSGSGKLTTMTCVSGTYKWASDYNREIKEE
ncbi:hypothetical protein ACGH6R_00030 [Gilliamella sp. CG13]|uniref:hypothetical protein n=1 Tax=Gilliamella sp. CG13 TaxID=3351502 RepID=UPI003987D6A9